MEMEADNSSEQRVSTVSGGEATSVSSSGNHSTPPPPLPIVKKKRNLPGMPDPDAEVIALSPKTLMATNRFVCEICNKGFQRDQNLQLHRRGHNLPWKLRQRSTTEIRKRVYVCPETTCVHHDPSRALGDLTGIKKHFCRKHGEKKWKCEKCSKKYAVQSDWKAHLKTCGTREYRCDCGTLFSRRDSFITHRAFCDALAEESAKTQPQPQPQPQQVQISIPEETPPMLQSVASSTSSPTPPPPPPSTLALPSNTNQNPRRDMVTDQFPENSSAAGVLHKILPSTCVNGSSGNSSTSTANNGLFENIFNSARLQPHTSSFSDFICAMARSETPAGLAQGAGAEPTSLSLASSNGSSFFGLEESGQFAAPQPPTMSATALLQKAAQMGAAATSGSFLRSFGVSMSSSSGQDNSHWNGKIDGEHSPPLSGLSCDGNSRLTELMMAPSTLFGPEPTTLDFLGLGMAGNGSSKGGYSALISSIDSELDIAAASSSFGARDL